MPMFPPDFIKRIRTQSNIDADSLVAALREPSPVSVRINTGKWDRKPSSAEPVPWCETGYYLESRPSFTLDPLFHSGCYYPREASGMFLEEVFRQVVNPSENLRVLDLSAAPGGKSTQISDLIGDSSLLVANEVIRARSAVLAETIAKWGKDNTLVTQNDPSAFSRLNGYFDIIVIDAPCSGEGMFRDKTAIGEWSENNATLCSERQKRIISDIWPALKEDGLLIYSTCTFNPGENEENMLWLIKNRQAECVKLETGIFKKVVQIDYQGITGYGFYPDKVRGEGFFLSVVRKKEAQPGVQVRSQRRQEFTPGRTDIEMADRWIGTGKERLLKVGENLFNLPCAVNEYLYLFGNLNVIRPGTLISVSKKSDFLPTHELALSQKIKKDAFPVYDADYREALALLRRDNLSLQGLHDGWNLITFNGVNIGFVKNIGKRVNNYFPVEWRIRMTLPEPGKENIIEWQ